MKKAITLLVAVLSSSIAQAAAPYVEPQYRPIYIDPARIVKVDVIDATTVPWSFDMVREPSILPIIPEIALKQVVVNEVTITDYSISSDILFAFDKSEVDIENQIFLQQVTQHILDTYQTIDSVTVTGHTDRLGSDAYNNNLALKRAETVKRLLIVQGLNGDAIRVVSMGERSPVTNGCPKIKDRKKLKACLSPDRRVEIRVEGKARSVDIALNDQNVAIIP